MPEKQVIKLPGWMIQVMQSLPVVHSQTQRITTTCSGSTGSIRSQRWLTMSVRAFELESSYGLDILIPSHETPNSPCGSPLAWAKTFSAGKKASVGTAGEDAENEKSLSVSSNVQQIPVHAGGNCTDEQHLTVRTHAHSFLAAHARTPNVITRLAQGLTICLCASKVISSLVMSLLNVPSTPLTRRH